MLINVPKLVSSSVQSMVVENGDFIVKLGRSGVIKVERKIPYIEISISPLPIGLIVGAGLGNVHQALTRTHEFLVVDRAKFYGL